MFNWMDGCMIACVDEEHWRELRKGWQKYGHLNWLKLPKTIFAGACPHGELLDRAADKPGQPLQDDQPQPGPQQARIPAQRDRESRQPRRLLPQVGLIYFHILLYYIIIYLFTYYLSIFCYSILSAKSSTSLYPYINLNLSLILHPSIHQSIYLLYLSIYQPYTQSINLRSYSTILTFYLGIDLFLGAY